MIHMSRFTAMLGALSLLGLVPVEKADTTTGLVAYYPFDGNANDFSGKGRNGTAYNAVTYVPGVKGQAANFNGINAYIKASSDGLPGAERTVSLWFFANTIKMPRPVMLGYGGGTGCGTSWFMMLDPSPSPPFYISGHCHSYDLWAPYYQVPIGAWYHLAITTSQTGTKFFVNGQNVASDPLFVGNTAVLPGRDLTIGVDVWYQGYGPYTDSNVGYFDGKIDELRIYNRALSHDEILELYQGTSSLTISTATLSSVQKGTFSSQQLGANLGSAPLRWSIVTGALPSGMTLSSSGVLSGTPTVAGSFPLNVQVTDNQNQVAQKAFAFDVLLIAPSSAIHVSETLTIPVPGRTVEKFIVVENTGNATANNLDVVTLVDPSVSLLSTVPPSGGTSSSQSAAAWKLPDINPGTFAVLEAKARVSPSTPLGKPVCSASCISGQSDPKGVALCVGKVYLDLVADDACRFACSIACSPLKDAFDCLTNPTNCWFSISDCFNCFGKCSEAVQQNACHCLNVIGCAPPNPTPITRGALDPNEKVAVPARFMKPDQPIVYPIHFENIGTIEARDVFVIDVLDTNLDTATLTLLTPGATFDPATRTVRWSLLNTNLAPGASDSVLFSVRPKSALSSGTAIRNKATIQFEVFTPMDTNEVVNIIDSTRPSCTINPIPSQINTTDIQVSWSGADAVGEIDSYSILVSKDGGKFEAFLSDVKDSSAAFEGQVGSTYGFLCVAKDTAGNIELQSDTAEATTTITTPHTIQCTGCYFLIGGTRAILAFNLATAGSASIFSYNYRTSTQTVQFVSTTTAQVSVNGNTATFSGQGKLNGQSGYNFSVTAKDGGSVGSGLDTVSIAITGPNNLSYSTSGTIAGGDIVVK